MGRGDRVRITPVVDAENLRVRELKLGVEKHKHPVPDQMFERAVSRQLPPFIPRGISEEFSEEFSDTDGVRAPHPMVTTPPTHRRDRRMEFPFAIGLHPALFA